MMIWKKRILKNKRAASLTGYGLVVGLIAVVAISAVSSTGEQVQNLFGFVANNLDDARAGVVDSGSGSGGGGGGAPDDGCPNIGDTCTDGTIYAGLSLDDSEKLYIMPTDQSGSVNWKNVGTASFAPVDMCSSGSTTCFTGAANTAFLTSTANFPSGTHLAAEVCTGFSGAGNNDWFLPSIAELDVIYSNMVANNHVTPSNDTDNPVPNALQADMQGIGDANPSSLSGPLAGSFTTSDFYWNSSEGMIRVRFSDGAQFDSSKTFPRRVRCVRR